MPQSLYGEQWSAYHLGDALQFVRPDHDVLVDRRTGMLRRYRLRRAGTVLREVRLESEQLDPPPFDPAVFALGGPIDEAGSRAVALQFVRETLSVLLQVLADRWVEAGADPAQAARRDRAVRRAFAEMVLGAFGVVLRAEARTLCGQVWEALDRARPALERAAVVRELVGRRLAAMLTQALAVHGVDVSAVRKALRTARARGSDAAPARAPAQRRREPFVQAIERASADVVETVLRREVDPALERRVQH